MTIQTAPPGAAPPGSADTADQAAPLDGLLADAALGTFRRFAPDASAVKFAAALAPHTTGRRMSSLAAELMRIGAGTSALWSRTCSRPSGLPRTSAGPTCRTRRGGYPPGVQLRLLPFGKAALQHFVYLERPEGVEGADAEGFEPAGPAPPPMRREEVAPRGQDFATQGHLYRSIERGFARLADKLGEDRLFIGPAFQQADEAAFGWPDLGPITGLEGANRALERIVEQGEGATGDWAAAHYGRFLEVREDYLAMRNTDPGFEPAHPVAAAGMRAVGMRAVEGIEPAVYITDPATGGCSDLFNAVYELVLQMIARYFAFGHETPGQRQVLARAETPLGCRCGQASAGPLAGHDHGLVHRGANFRFLATRAPRGVAPLRRVLAASPRGIHRTSSRKSPPRCRGPGRMAGRTRSRRATPVLHWRARSGEDRRRRRVSRQIAGCPGPAWRLTAAGYWRTVRRGAGGDRNEDPQGTGARSPVSHEPPQTGPGVILTPDQRIRVFISSTLEELAGERVAARRAIARLRLVPVWYESGARPHPPRSMYRAYLAQSQVFVGIYWQRYGWVAPGMDISGLEDEYRLAAGKPMLLST